MVSPRNHAKVFWHFKFVNDSLTNYIVLIIKLIPSFCILDVGDGKTGLSGECGLEVEAQTIEERASPFGCFVKF